MKRWSVVFSVVVVLSLLITPGVLAREVKNPDTFVVAHYGEPESLDPAWMYDTSSAAVAYNVYESVVAFNRMKADEFVPALATEWNLSDDGLTWTFKIREGVKFHEGGTLEPHDIAYSLQRGMLQDRVDGPQILFLEPFFGVGTSTILDVVNQVGDLKVEDSSTIDLTVNVKAAEDACKKLKEAVSADDKAGTVTLKLAQPTPWLLQILAQQWGAALDMEWQVKQGDWDGDCATWTKWHNPAAEASVLFNKMNGTGPYKFDHWTPGEEIVLVANENYWRTEPKWQGGPTGPARIKRVNLKLVEEWGTRLAMFQAGDIDYGDVDAAFYSQVDPMVKTIYWEGDENGKSEEANPDGQLIAFRNLARPAQTGAMMNFKVNTEGGNPFILSGKLDGQGIPPDFFSDIHVRKAFCYSFDWDTFINDAFQGEAVQPKGPIPMDMLGYRADQPTYSYDPAKAEAEFKAAWGGKLWETGFAMQLVYNTGNDVRRIAAELIKANVEALNPKFKIDVVSLPWANFLEVRTQGKLPIMISGWLEDYHDPSNWVQPFMHPNGSYSRMQNFPKELGDQFLELINQGVKLTDPKERAPIYEKLQNLAYENAITIFLYQPYDRHYFQEWVKGWYYNPLMPEPYADIYSLSKEM